jgi:hypothetical protein
MSAKAAAGTNAAYNSQDFGTSHWRLINQATSGARCAKGARALHASRHNEATKMHMRSLVALHCRGLTFADDDQLPPFPLDPP